MTESEKHLRVIIKDYAELPHFDGHALKTAIPALDDIIDAIAKASQYIDGLDRCQFVSDNGVQCHFKAAKEVNGIRCCIEHIRIRKLCW